MPRDGSIHKILLIGSGPITIGQACEFDYSGTQALRALKAEGYEVILVNSNPATIMTDPGFADHVYVEPLTVEFLEMIIRKEKPDAILPTMGGQTALNLAVALAEKGILERHGVRMLGANLESIKKAEDRALFKQTMLKLGLDVPRSTQVSSVEEGMKCLREIGLPLILRPSFTLGGEGGGVARTEEEFCAILERGLFLSPTKSVLVEESLVGWKEYELEVVRDKKDNVIIVCSIENLDPMGVHTGDSITVAPAQTLTDRQYQQLRDYSKKIIREINVETGGSNIQFAVKPSGPNAGRVIVIEMNPRVSRSSALASKATGFPIAKVAARLAVGYTLEELSNEITGSTPASFEPTIDYVVTKIPRFDFAKFSTTSSVLGTQMKSVGEVMAIGRTFKESLMKAVCGLENSDNWLRPTEYDDPSTPIAELEEKLRHAFHTRLWYAITALRRGLTPKRVCDLSGIDPWFLEQILELVDAEKWLKQNAKNCSEWPTETWADVKALGFLDRDIARASGLPEALIYKERISKNVESAFDLVDTCAGEFEARTPYLYSTFSSAKGSRDAASKNTKGTVMILGGGPNRIGQGIEFDYCCVHASETVREMGFDSIMVNSNPETVSTDYDVSSKLYFEPLTVEHVWSIVNRERELAGSSAAFKGAIVQFGGQTPLKLAGPLSELGLPILGTNVENIDIAEDRERFADLMTKIEADLGPDELRQPPSKTVISVDEAVRAAEVMGFPILLRPSYVLGGRGMRVVFSIESLLRYIQEAIEISDKKPVLMDRYLSNAIEVDVDAISDGETVLVGGVMEHIEEAGVHSGDSACSLPVFTLSPSIVSRLRKYSRILAQRLNVLGLINIQFAVQGNDVYVLEVNPRASRTVPFVSKAVGVPLAKVATKIMLGAKLKDLGYTKDFDLGLDMFNVKMPVFPFHKFPNVDVLLGPEMKSTGEVMGRAPDFASAYAKALLGAGVQIPTKGRAFLSIADKDKTKILEIARRLVEIGFSLEATSGTSGFLRENKIPCETVSKVSQGVPNCVTRIAEGHYQFVINTTSGEKAIYDSYAIRRTVLEKKIPYCTLITMARAYLEAITTRQTKVLTLHPISGGTP